jgi:hypothetical protein
LLFNCFCEILHVCSATESGKNVQKRITSTEFAGQLDFSTAFTSASWSIAERYVCAGGWIYPEGEAEQWSFPLTGSNLFLSFARLGARGAPSRASVLRWVKGHGLLRRRDENRDAWDSLENGEINQAPMFLEDFRAEVLRALWLLNVYAEVRLRNTGALRARSSNPRSALDDRLARDFYDSIDEVGFTITATSKEPEIIWLAFSTLAEVTEEMLAMVRLVTEFGSPNEFDPASPRIGQAWRCPDLLSAIYMQFFLLLTANKSMQRCENPACRMLFPATRKGKRYCNDTCRSNARYHRQRQIEAAN